MKDLITNIAEIFTRKVGKKNQNDQEIENQKAAKTLFVTLADEKYDKYPFEKMNLDEGMILIKEVIGSYWKPRYLINTHKNEAYEIMNLSETLLLVTDNDIDWDSLKNLGEDCLERAKSHSFHFPSFIYQFENGVAQVQWQLNPDGRYYEDEDGYGMTDDEEVNIYGFIDTRGKVIVLFQHVSGQEMIDKLRIQAEKIVKSGQKKTEAHAGTDKMFATERKARTRFFDRIAKGESCCDMQEDYFEDK